MIEKCLNNRFFVLYLIPFVLGSSTVFSYQPFNLTLINFFILPIFFYLIVYIKQKSKNTYRKKPYKKNLFIFGLAFGFGYYLFGIYWITHSLTFDESFKILIPFGLILIPLFLSLFFSLVTLVIGPFLNLNIISIFFLSGSLAFSDYLRAKVLTGFPWNLWAYSFSWATEIIQILNLIGLFAFNLLSITIFMFPAILFFNIKLSKKFLSLTLIFFLLFFLYIYGNHTINKNESFLKSNIEKFNIKVISPNFNLEYGLTPQAVEDRLIKLIRYSEPNKDLKTMFVWPEGVFSGYSFEEILEFKYIIEANFNKNHLILFGINTLDQEKDGLYNSLVIVNNQLEIIQQYKKQKLVPFGEFLPLKNILNSFGLKKITEGHGSFSKGTSSDIFTLGNLKMLPLICYEIIFPELSQKEKNMIINISEDAWFGNTIGPDQHFAKAIFRAIESNVYLIRSANKGFSAFIDNKGIVKKVLKPNETGVIELNVPIINNMQKKYKIDLIFFVLLFTCVFTISILNKKK
jgi:apolipoprotein N-acyltransferase